MTEGFAFGRGRASALRRYPALVFVAGAGVLALLLPSALTVPTSGPPTLAEFAPVPGEGPGGGPVGRLGLGSSDGTGSNSGRASPAGEPTAPAQPTASLKRCVGKPPRQTEDPMSPPCVAFFEGDNGGRTYPGVTSDEITVLVYADTGTYNVGDAVESSPPAGSWCDLDTPENEGGVGCWVPGSERDHGLVRIARAYSRYFNLRFQTYGRHVHYWMHWASARTAAAKRADAVDQVKRIRPFAVLDETVFSGDDEAYADALARRGVLVFPGQGGGTVGNGAQSAAYFRRYAPQIWSFIPDVEHWAEGIVSYVCRKVAPHPVAHAQGGIDRDGRPMNGRARRLGLLVSEDPDYPNLHRFADLVDTGLRGCGAAPVVRAPADDASQSAVAVARLIDARVTTVLVAGPPITYLSQAADSAKYYPEIVIAGDGFSDRNLTARLANQNVMRNAWIATYQIGFQRLEEDFGFRACVEGDPALSRSVCQFASTRYRDNFLLFKVIQAAGPRLTPAAVDRGMHAIPHLPSDGPQQAACFFDTDDYSCVKDLIEEWWDGSGRPPGAQSPGCWRMVRAGRRFLPKDWPRSDDVFDDPSDPCNAYTLGGPYDP